MLIWSRAPNKLSRIKDYRDNLYGSIYGEVTEWTMVAVLKTDELSLRRFESCPCRQQLRVSINAELATLRCKFNKKSFLDTKITDSSGGNRYNNSLASVCSIGNHRLPSKASSRVVWGCTFACYSPFFFDIFEQQNTYWSFRPYSVGR